MKKKLGIMFLLLLVAVVASYAQNSDNAHYAVSELAVAPFQKLVVNTHIDVVLVQNDTLKKAYIEGDERLVSAVSITVVNGTMTISSPKNISFRGKVQVTVAVQELQKLEINADAGIVSFEALHTPRLYVNVNGDCDLHLKSNGQIFLDAGDGYWIKYKTSTPNISNVIVLGTIGESVVVSRQTN